MKAHRLKEIIQFMLLMLVVLGWTTVGADPKLPEYVDMIKTDESDRPLNYPSFVFSDPSTGEVYINQMLDLVVFTPDLFPVFTFGSRNGIYGVWSVIIDSKGYTYVSTGGVMGQPIPKIMVFNPAFRLQREIFFSEKSKSDRYSPNRIALGRTGKLYVLETYDNKVLVCDLSGKVLDTLTILEEGEPAPFVDIHIDANGRIYLVNEKESKIYVFDENHRYLYKFGEKGGSSSKLSRPLSIAVDAELGLIYVCDYMRHAVNVYDYSGNYYSEFGGMGWTEGWFHYPSRVAVDRAGRIFVADTFNSRVQMFAWKHKPDVEKKTAKEAEAPK